MLEGIFALFSGLIILAKLEKTIRNNSSGYIRVSKTFFIQVKPNKNKTTFVRIYFLGKNNPKPLCLPLPYILYILLCILGVSLIGVLHDL